MTDQIILLSEINEVSRLQADHMIVRLGSLREEFGWELREQYSGRGMMGRNCIAFIGPHSPHKRLPVSVQTEIISAIVCEHLFLKPSLDEMMNVVRNLQYMEDHLRYDNMGHGTVAYLPGIRVADDEDEQ